MLPVDEARRNDEVISISDSQMLRWIDELNGITDADAQAREIKLRIRKIKKEPVTRQTRQEISRLYGELDRLQFKPDYMCLIIDKPKDYYRACKGFKINGIKYARLLGTNGGIKNSTIVFVSERLAPELRRRIENGRDPDKKIVTAKLEAYKALTCSASTPVSMPHGVLVIPDAETTYYSDIIYLSDEDDGEPVMETRTNVEITADASDGYGMMLPSLAERWSDELALDYTVSGVNTRNSFEKGMVFTFDFVDFAEKVAQDYIVKDAWGNDVDVRDVELVLTTSMLKLWDSYESCEDYITKSTENGYTFGISKTCPKELENERCANYQFLNPYELTDEEIDELIAPTMEEVRDVLGGDWRKAVLYLKGSGLTDKSVINLEDDFIKAMLADERVTEDPFVRSMIYQLIRFRIDEAKVGVVKVHGNYSMISGDPYLLCQSMFGLDKTGLLGAGEIYNEYWADIGAERLACFRAPMTCHNNIRMVRPLSNDDVRYWYQYMHTATVFNSWDTAPAALNGCDFDGDSVMLTDNRILVEKMKELPALMCAQRAAVKRVSSEEDFIRSNIESFGNDIGQTTNWVTSMFDVQADYAPGSEEYNALAYRIRCGQLYQQNAIDKAKGIICKPMPREWHDRHAANKIEDEKKREFYRKIVADKKPYFMRYIYPELKRKYNTYIKNTNRNALREFGITVDSMLNSPYKDLTPRMQEFLQYYEYNMPVSTNGCVTNRICRRIESAFDGFVTKTAKESDFDYSFMRTDAEYTMRQYNAIRQLYEEYNKRSHNFEIYKEYERVDNDESAATYMIMYDEFIKECAIACPNEDALCNIVLDICYAKAKSKRFAWIVAGQTIVRNLIERNGGLLSYPTADENGDIIYCGNRYSMHTVSVKEDEE